MPDLEVIIPLKDELGNTLGFVVLDGLVVVQVIRFSIPMIALCFN